MSHRSVVFAARKTAMKALSVTNSAGETLLYPLGEEAGSGYRIGRSPECEIALAEDESLSAVHCSVITTEEGVQISDLGSSNGVQQGERAVQAELMQPGVVYTVGHNSLTLAEVPDAAPAEAAAPAPQEEVPAPAAAPRKAVRRGIAHPIDPRARTLRNNSGGGVPGWLWLIILAVLIGGGIYLYKLLNPPPPPAEKPVVKAEKKPQKKVTVDDWQREDEPEPEPEKTDEPEPEPEPEAEEEEEPIPEEVVVVQKSSTGQEWKQPRVLKQRLSSAIRSRLRHVDEGNVERFLSDPENCLMVAQWELLNRADLNQLGIVMRDPAVCKDLSKLLNNSAWCGSFVYDGEMTKPEVALAMVAEFRAADLKRKDRPDTTEEQEKMKERMAAAIAVEFARNGWYADGKELTEAEMDKYESIGMPQPEKKRGARRQEKGSIYMLAVERYLLFAEGIEQDLLNSSFWKQPDWLLHFIGGWKGENAFGSATTMRWARDNCSVPDEQYKGLAGRVPYLPLNEFGDVIFSSKYYEPYKVIYPNNMAKMTRDIGAVCGGLSHFGTTGAVSNGVPAVTMGEPGHCAYTVYLDGQWHCCNSVSEKHTPHWSFGGEYSWSAFQMMTAMYQEKDKTRRSQLIGSLASVMVERRNTKDAVKLYEMSLAIQPLNLPVWRVYMGAVEKKLKRNPAMWQALHHNLCTALIPKHPARAGDYLMEEVYPSMLPLFRAPAKKLETYEEFFANLDEIDDKGWKYERVLDTQFKALDKSTVHKQKYLDMVRETMMKKPHFHQMLVWAVNNVMTENKPMSKRFLEAVDKDMETCEDREMVLAAMIQAAEMLGDEKLFHKYTAAVGQTPQVSLPDIPEYKGKLISEGAMLQLSTYGDDEKHIIQHAAALTPRGGKIQTESSKTEYLKVILPKRATIGCIVMAPAGPKGGVLEVSSDGETWETLMSLPDAGSKGYHRLEFEKMPPTAKYVRVSTTSQGGNASLNFNAFHIYEKSH